VMQRRLVIRRLLGDRRRARARGTADALEQGVWREGLDRERAPVGRPGVVEAEVVLIEQLLDLEVVRRTGRGLLVGGPGQLAELARRPRAPGQVRSGLHAPSVAGVHEHVAIEARL